MNNKVLLFYPSFTGPNQEQPLYTDIPLSVVTLALKLHNKYNVEIIDERIEMVSSDIKERLKNVFVVGISATTSYQIISGLNFARQVKQYRNDIVIVWGGWHASLMPHETIMHQLVDIIIIGQGDWIFERLVQKLFHQEDISAISNIIYKSGSGKIVETRKQQYNNLQMPESIIDGYGYVNMEKYIHSGWGNRHILGYESSRGCPYACSFCSISAVFRRKWYGIPAKNVMKDISYLKRGYGVDAIHFFDNNFFVDKKRVFDFAALLMKHKIKIQWDGTVVIKQFLALTQKELELLKQSGFYRIIVGVESGDEEVLNSINKIHENGQVLELVKRCKDYDILPTLSFMVGFPWNPEKDTYNTIRLIEKIKSVNPKTEILLFVFSPYLGTSLYNIAKEYNMAFPDSLEGWSSFTYDKANTPWMTRNLKKRIDRYLSFFGTKEMSEKQQLFLRGFE